MFEHIEPYAGDPILALVETFQADPRAHKVNLSIGIYFDEDGRKHNKDGSEACYEYATGKKSAYAKPRYDSVILMEPDAYQWIPGRENGVWVKRLGTFTERNMRIGLTRIDQDATFTAGTEDATELLFLSKGAVSVSGRNHGERTAFEFLANEGPIPVKATAASEFLSIVLPKF